jgi:hypothetical protein
VDSDDIDFHIGEHPPSHVPSSATLKKHSAQILPNVALAQKTNCKLLKIARVREFPIFHFEINGKIYFYGFKGMRGNDIIVLRCSRMAKNGKSQCNNSSTILPSETFINTKYLDKSDPMVYDINNYDINSFEIGRGHKCSGTEIDVYLKSHKTLEKALFKKVNSDDTDFYIGEHPTSHATSSATIIQISPQILPKADLAQINNCKLIKIADVRGNPIFHFEINRKVYFYAFKMITAAYKIMFYCTTSKCSMNSSILPTDSLKEIIKTRELPYTCTNSIKYFDKSHPKVYDINNYDINSFEIRGEHKCRGTAFTVYLNYLNSQNKPVLGLKEVKQCKLVDICNHRGHPQFHFEIDRKLYVYGLQRIRSDYRIVLCCSKGDRENRKLRCGNSSTIMPSEFLKKIIQNSPKYSPHPKFLDKSDPKVFDISNYVISSFNIGRGHKCAGTEIDRNA